MDLGASAHRRVGHGPSRPGEALVKLADADDGVEYTDMTQRAVDADVRAEARRIVEDGGGARAPPQRGGTHAFPPRVGGVPKRPHATVSVETTWVPIGSTGA